MTDTIKFRHLPALAAIASLLAIIFVACGEESSSSSASEVPADRADGSAMLEKAPEFTLPSANTGSEISLSQFQGDRAVVLVFYRAYW